MHSIAYIIDYDLIKEPTDLHYLPVEPLSKEIPRIRQHKGDALLIKPPIV